MSRRRFLSLGSKLAALSVAPALIRTASAQEGLSAKTVTIGCSCALSGPLGGFGAAIKVGAEAAIAQINAKGGVQGRQIQLQIADDGYVPQRTTENVKKMIGDGSVFALMSCLGTPNNAAILPMVEASSLPYLAPLTGATSLRNAGTRNVFHVRASYTDETQRLVQKLLGMGIKDLGIVYLDNAFGKELLADAMAAMAAKGAQPIVHAALATDGKNLSDVVARVMAAKPAAVLLGTAGAASVGLIEALKKASPMMPLAGQSMTLSGAELKSLGAAGSGMALTMVFPDPHRANTQVVRDYQAAMRASGKEDFSPGSLESYINTRVLAEGLERAGRDLTRAKLRTALLSFQKFDLGGFSVDYSTAAPFVGSRYVDLGVLGASGRFIG
jgi:ABC-type branched-subunit amino acid transport system substrate-binding protein